MKSFRERYGMLTVAQAERLNKAIKEYEELKAKEV